MFNNLKAELKPLWRILCAFGFLFYVFWANKRYWIRESSPFSFCFLLLTKKNKEQMDIKFSCLFICLKLWKRCILKIESTCNPDFIQLVCTLFLENVCFWNIIQKRLVSVRSLTLTNIWESFFKAKMKLITVVK